jgi:hypothetical protein
VQQVVNKYKNKKHSDEDTEFMKPFLELDNQAKLFEQINLDAGDGCHDTAAVVQGRELGRVKEVRDVEVEQMLSKSEDLLGKAEELEAFEKANPLLMTPPLKSIRSVV